jgi:beta-glucanase (GH16 family)
VRNFIGTTFFLIALSLTACKKENTGGGTPETTPNLTISDVFKPEGTGGNSNMDFVLKLSSPAKREVSVRVATKEGFAKAGEDYTAVDQKIIFAAGETQKTVSVSIVGDDLKEGIDDFQLALSEPVNCVIISNYATGTIDNDDTKIPVSDAGYTTPLTYAGRTLVWSDEFNGSALNTTDWNYDVGDGCPNCGWGNNELEFYTAGENLYFSQGKMIIEARKESRGGKNYTSSRLTTMGKKSFKFGRIDMRAKLPKGQGIWPAFWMLGDNFPTAGWPTCGEIDIMEFLGHELTKVYSTIHFRAGTGSRNISKSFTNSTPIPDEYHVYSLVWETDKMRMLIDDKLIGEFQASDIGGAAYPFNEKFFFLLNVAVGGNWPGSPNATTYFPQWMFVDYVRVFQ